MQPRPTGLRHVEPVPPPPTLIALALPSSNSTVTGMKNNEQSEGGAG